MANMARIRQKCKGKKKPTQSFAPGEELEPGPLSEAPGSWGEPHSSGQALLPRRCTSGILADDGLVHLPSQIDLAQQRLPAA